jgi:hypothetical protein
MHPPPGLVSADRDGSGPDGEPFETGIQVKERAFDLLKE